MAKQQKAAGGRIRVKQIGSLIGCTEKQRASVRGLGLRRMNQTVVVADTPEIRGMIHASRHLFRVEEA